MYAKAIEYKPDFDVALANMGNAMKDTVRLAVGSRPNILTGVTIREEHKKQLNTTKEQSKQTPISRKRFAD
jgi:hypothetical protein